MPAIFRNRKFRDILFQVIFVSCIFGVLISAVMITRRNLNIQGIKVGWDFLDYATGWTIAFNLIPYDINSTYARALTVGFANTLLLAMLTLICSTLLGGTIGTARLSSHRLLSKLAMTYVQIFRNLPLILQAFFWYAVFTHLPGTRDAYNVGGVAFFTNRGFYFPTVNIAAFAFAQAFAVAAGVIAVVYFARKGGRIPTRDSFARVMEVIIVLSIMFAILSQARLPDTPLFDIPVQRGLRFSGGLELTPEFTAAFVAISLFGASYIAEIVRAGLLAVSPGKIEAGLALGLNNSQIFWKIRLPLAIRIMLPTLTNQYVWLVKATSIGIAIGFSDFFMVVANSINHSGQTLSLIAILVLGFWAINLSLAAILNAINRAIALRGQNVR